MSDRSAKSVAPAPELRPSHQDFVSKEPFRLELGGELAGLTLRYETYGTLLPDKSNAILVPHALSGDHHVAGRYSPEDAKPGWWDHIVGPGKAIDTNRFFVIGINCIGGCRGSTGPVSVDPRTGKLSTKPPTNYPGSDPAKCDRDRMALAYVNDEQEFRDILDEANR